MHEFVQSAVDVLIIVMAAVLVLFTVALIVLHIITTSNNKRVEKIKRRIMRMLSAAQDLEYLRGRIYELLDPQGEIKTLKDIRGIQSNRGTIALSIVVEEVTGVQRDYLRSIVMNDEWYCSHIHKNLRSRNEGRIGVFTKLIAELRLQGFEDDIYSNLYRFKGKAEDQEVSLLALFMCGSHDKLIALFSDPEFRLVLSFRQIQELFSLYTGDHEELTRELMAIDCDKYLIRVCIRAIGNEGMVHLCPEVMPYLDSDNINLIIDSVRTLGTLKYEPAAEAVRKHTSHPVWSVRSTAATALRQISPDTCYDDLLRCLCDSEWWVRFHAAEALSTLPGHPDLMDDVIALDDRFAFEMMRYILERNRIMTQGDAA